LVAAYRVAVRQAGELAAALDRAGLGSEVLAVTSGLDDRGEPVVTGTLTLAGARRLAALLAAGPPPPCRWAGLKVWHAVVCVLLGFYLASSSLAPSVASVARALFDALTG
jgi:hypothetical protein